MNIIQVNEMGRRARDLLDEGELAQALDLFLELNSRGYSQFDAQIGWIYDNLTPRRSDLAVKYYTSAASLGDLYSQYALGGLYREQGDIENAAKSYARAADNGQVECFLPAYRMLRSLGKPDAEQYLRLSVEAGDPFAIQELAIRSLRGEFGYKKIASGFVLFLKNMRPLWHAAAQLRDANRKEGVG